MITENAYYVIEHLYPGAFARGEYTLRDDGGGIFIDQWSRPEPKPTDAEIAAAEPAAMAAKLAADLVAYAEASGLRRGALLTDPDTEEPVVDPNADLETIRRATNRLRVKVIERSARGSGAAKTRADATRLAEEAIAIAVYDITADIVGGSITTEQQVDDDPRWPA